jgi:hypothetical protein
MSRTSALLQCVSGFLLAAGIGFACGGDGDGGSADMAGDVCEVIDDCYPDVDHADLHGDVQCLDRVESGYCTHLCQSDADCCAADGECETDLPQVCGPFESTGLMMCFLSCEAEDVGDGDPDAYCHEHAHEDFICRSTGGGSANRKVCVPNG